MIQLVFCCSNLKYLLLIGLRVYYSFSFFIHVPNQWVSVLGKIHMSVIHFKLAIFQINGLWNRLKWTNRMLQLITKKKKNMIQNMIKIDPREAVFGVLDYFLCSWKALLGICAKQLYFTLILLGERIGTKCLYNC